MDINKTVKQIYSRLYRKGLNISSELIKEEILKISPSGELSEEEKNSIIKYFLENASELTVSIKDTEISEDKTEIIPYSANNSSKPSINLDQAKSLVLNQVDILGLDLKFSEIRTIAETIVQTNESLENAVEIAINLISSYVERKESEYLNKLENNINGLVNELNISFNRKNNKTKEAFDTIRAGLEVSSNSYKSDIKDFVTDIEEYFKNL